MSASEGSTIGGIPPEVVTFLSGKGGRSLIVKGGAGTGKTTFGLELLERVGQPSRSYYLSTRIGDEALYRQFPWLKSTEMRTRVLDAAKLFLDAIGPGGRPATPNYPRPSRRRSARAARSSRASDRNAVHRRASTARISRRS